VGSSPVVQYGGTGAYFLDKLEKGVWRLEVMPDAIHIRDPFAKASPHKEVTRIQWQMQGMEIKLADLGDVYFIRGVNEGNGYSTTAKAGAFQVQPGTYLITRKEGGSWNPNSSLGSLLVKEFVAPQPFDTKPYVAHQPAQEVSAGKPFTIQAQVVGITAAAKVSLQLNNLAGVYKTVAMEKVGAYQYQAQVPVDLAAPGLINYRIMIQDGKQHVTFPGGYEGDPWAWDYYQNDTWQTFVAAEKGRLELFNATTDRGIFVYPNIWQKESQAWIPAEKPGQLVLKLAAKELPGEQTMGFQHAIAHKLKERATELASFDKLVVRIRTSHAAPVQVKVSLISDNAAAFASLIKVENTFQEIEIPINSLKPDSIMLLPRPYPGFQLFWFKAAKTGAFHLRNADKLELSLNQEGNAAIPGQNYSFEVESVWLEKNSR
jgi:hypothetical protein